MAADGHGRFLLFHVSVVLSGLCSNRFCCFLPRHGPEAGPGGGVRSILSIETLHHSGPACLHSPVCSSIAQGTGLKPLQESASAVGTFANLHMNGGEVFKFAVRAVPTVRFSPNATS